MKKIIIRSSEPFNNSPSYRYDDEDASTLGDPEVFEAIVIRDNYIESSCRLVGNRATKYITSPAIIVETTIKPGTMLTQYREAKLEELQEAINVLVENSYQFNGGSSEYVNKLRAQLLKLQRDNTLDKLI